jgi:hypothetical protein
MKAMNKNLLIDISDYKSNTDNPQLLRMFVNSEFTRIDLGYSAKWYYEKGGWIDISPDTYLHVLGNETKYLLKSAEGVPIAPEKNHFESIKDWTCFSLYFEPLPIQNLRFHIIEDENPTDDNFNYYDIDLEMEDAMEIIELS